MRGAELATGAVVAAEDDRTAPLAAGHVEHLGNVVQDLVRGDEAEGPGHELDDGLEAVHRGADGEAREAVLADGRVDDALGAELVEHALADLVRAVVLRDFLAHQEHAVVAAHLLRHRLAECFAELEESLLAGFGGEGREGLREIGELIEGGVHVLFGQSCGRAHGCARIL